jgi:hypothetical protein
VIPDDDDITGLPETDIRLLQYERVDAGSCVVHGQIVINGEHHVRRIECKNPAFAFGQIQEEIINAVLIGIRDEKQTAATAEAGAEHRRDTRLRIGGKDKAPLRKKRQGAED